VTHSGNTGLAITSSTGYVDVESVRFTGAQFGISTDTDLIALTNSKVTVSGNLEASGSITLTSNLVSMTHSGSTGFIIASSGGYVDVESVRFTGNELGISGDTDLISLTNGQVTVSGKLETATLDVNSGADVAGTLTLSSSSQEVRHTGATGLTLYSTGGYVQVEDLRFTSAGSAVDVSTTSSRDITVTSGRGITLTPSSSKAVTLQGNVITAYATAQGSDAGVSIPDGTTSFVINSGTGQSSSFALSFAGTSPVNGQLLFIRNDSSFASTGLIVASNSGALFMYSGGSWLKVL